MRGSSIVALLALGGLRQEEYRCTYQKKVECAESGQCRTTPVGSAYLLVPNLDSLLAADASFEQSGQRFPQIRRCDAKGCSAIDVSAAPSGMFTNISARGGGYYLKIVTTSVDQVKRGTFVESISVFLSTVTYWGTCAIR